MYDFLLYFGLALWIGTGIFYLRRPAASMFHPVTYYLIVHGIVFTIRPILAWNLQYKGIYYAYEFLPSMETKEIVLLGADLALICFVATALWVGKAPFRAIARPIPVPVRADLVRMFLLVCVVLMPVAIMSQQASIASRTDDFSTMVLDKSTGFTVNTTGNGYFNEVSLALLPMLAILAWLLRFRWWAMLPLLAGILYRAATGGRWAFVVICFSLALFYLYETRKRWVSVRLAAMILLVLPLFTIVGQDRGQSIRLLFGTHEKTIVVREQTRPLESMDYGNMEFFEYLVNAIPEKTHTYGYFLSNLQLFTEPVPRVLWPGKPIGAPIKLYSLWDYGTPIGMTYSVPGEGWQQLGWIGIVIWSSLFGLFYGWLYNKFMRSMQTPVQIALYCIFMPLSITVFRDGSPLTMFKTALFTLLPILLWKGLLQITKVWPYGRRAPVRPQAGMQPLRRRA